MRTSPRHRKRSVEFSQNADGTVDVMIHFKGLEIDRRSSKRWFLVNSKGRLDQHLDVHGYKIKPMVIVKMYCRIPPAIDQQVRKTEVWKRIRTQSPLVYG